MTDLVAFLTARLDEDEAVARAAIVKYEHGDRWVVGHTTRREDYEFVSIHTPLPTVVEIAGSGFDGTGGIHGQQFAAHIARWDPGRVLREIEAKRKLAEMHADTEPHSLTFHYCQTCGSGEPHEYPTEWPCNTIKLLAAPYADHPDYDPAWAPQA